MPDPWESARLTGAARRARDHAVLRAGRGASAAEVLEAVAGIRPSVALAALEALGLSWESLGIEARSSPITGPIPQLDPEPSETARSLFTHAGEESLAMGHHHVSTGHLVLAILQGHAGSLPADAPVSHERFRAALLEVLGRPWVHGYALDGEVALYLSRAEALVLHGFLSRRRSTRHARLDERIVVEALRGLLAPVARALYEE